MTETFTEQGQSTLRVAIVEDYEWARIGLTVAIEQKSDHKIIAFAENGDDAVQMAHEAQPDVILMDIGLPIRDGISATGQIKLELPQIKIMMLTSHQDIEEVYSALAAGADAYCMKDIRIEQLIQVMAMVTQGAIWLDPGIASMLSHMLATRSPLAKLTNAQGDKSLLKANLTKREIEVLELIIQGKSNKEIAQILNITTNTAKIHVSNIIQKMEVDDRTQVVIKSLQGGFFDIKKDSPS